jgi:hypothetical protein
LDFSNFVVITAVFNYSSIFNKDSFCVYICLYYKVYKACFIHSSRAWHNSKGNKISAANDVESLIFCTKLFIHTVSVTNVQFKAKTFVLCKVKNHCSVCVFSSKCRAFFSKFYKVSKCELPLCQIKTKAFKTLFIRIWYRKYIYWFYKVIKGF